MATQSCTQIDSPPLAVSIFWVLMLMKILLRREALVTIPGYQQGTTSRRVNNPTNSVFYNHHHHHMGMDGGPSACFGYVLCLGPFVRTSLRRIECCPLRRELGTSMYVLWNPVGIYLLASSRESIVGYGPMAPVDLHASMALLRGPAIAR